MVSLMQLPKYNAGSALLDLSQLNQGIDSIQRANQLSIQNKRADEKMNMQREQFGMQKTQFEADQKQRQAALLANRASVIDGLPEGQRQAAYQRLLQGTPGLQQELAKAGVDPNDHINGPKFIMAEAGKYDPLGKQLKEAQINLANAKATQAQRAGAETFGKTGAVFRGEDGKYYTIQFGANGERRILPVDGGLTPDRGVTQVGNTLVDKTTGKVRQDVTQNIAAGEKAKQEGKAQGVASGSLANSIQVAGDMLKQINNLLSDPYLPSMTGLVGGRLPNISENAQRVDSKMKQITGSTFLVAYERLKGGGQITEIEGRKGEQAIARLNQAQSYNDYVEALNELKRVVQNGLIRSRVNAGQLPNSALTRLYDFEGQQPPSTGQSQPTQSAPQLPPGFSIKKVE